MTENHGAHGDAGATDNEDLNTQETAATNESAAASMDAQLESRAKNAAGHRRATWWIVAIVAVIAVVAVVAGCIAAFAGRKNDTTGAKANDTVTIGLKLAPTNLDIRNTAGSAIDQVLIGNVYEGLVARDEHNQVVPAIAKTWDVSDDGTTYTFHLNDGMTFSNGDKLDADDVAWSINELVTKQYHDADSLVNFVSVKASDPNTVELKLSAPYANLLWVLTGRPGLVFDKDAKYDAKTQAIGSGPYTFESWSNGAVTLQKNPTYWKGEPKIDTVIWREMTDEDKIPGVVSGTIDVTDPSYSKEAAEQIKEANSNGEISGDTIQTDLVANLGYGYVGFNANRVKVGDGNGGDEASKDLRKAIATVIAVYRDVAVDSYYGEFANVINYPISDTSWAAPRVTDEGYKVAFSVDVNGNDIYTEGMSADDKYAAAKQAALGYFEAAGYTVADGKITAAPAGGRMDAEVMVGGSGKGDHPSFMALTLASDALKEIGFNLIVSDMSNFAEMTNAINAGTADMFAMAWQATPDPDMFQIYHSKGGSNEKSYWIKDADLDELIMMARQSTDQTYRKTLYKQCLDIVADWAVEIPIYQRQNCVIFSAKRVNLDTVTPDITTYWAWYNDIELLDLQ